MCVDALLAPSLLAHDKTVYSGPLTEWFHFAVLKPDWLRRENPAQQVTAISEAHISRINHMLGNREFDLVILRHGKFGVIGANARGYPFAGNDGQENFRKNYHLAYSLELPMPDRRGAGTQQMQVWKPRDDKSQP